MSRMLLLPLVSLCTTIVAVIVATPAPPVLVIDTGYCVCDVAVDPEGNIFASLYSFSQPQLRIAKFHPNGTQIVSVSPPDISKWAGPQWGIDFRQTDGFIYMTNNKNMSIDILWSNNLTLAQRFVTIPRFVYPTSTRFDKAGEYLYTVDSDGNRIIKVEVASQQTVNVFTTSNPTLNMSQAIALDAAGNIYIADAGNLRIVKLSSTGKQLASFGLKNIEPYGVAVDGYGNIYVSDINAALVWQLDANGMFRTSWSTKMSTYGGPRADGSPLMPDVHVVPIPAGPKPTGLTVDENGNLYVANYSGGQIIVFYGVAKDWTRENDDYLNILVRSF